jgi:hypothetical protein
VWHPYAAKITRLICELNVSRSGSWRQFLSRRCPLWVDAVEKVSGIRLDRKKWGIFDCSENTKPQ